MAAGESCLRARGAAVRAHRMGARSRASRRALRAAHPWHRDRARPRRCPARRVPASARAVPSAMSTPHPLTPEARLLTANDLAGLILALAIVGFPHALRAPWWLALLTLALYGWRALL